LGGAVYVCGPVGDCTGTCPGSSLTLDDSTLVGNSVDAGSGSEGGALWGSGNDTLALANSILYGNTPQPEIYGFGTLTLKYSDVCAETGGPAVPSGAGNICANPNLNADGTETENSPTVDAGSNALVPAGLTTDIAGNPRIVANHLGCTSTPQPAVVDMGAFEATFHGPAPPCPPPPFSPPVISAFTQSAPEWLEGNLLASISSATKKLPVGTTFRFTLSEAASVTLSFQQSLPGRRVAKKCVAKSKHNAKKPHCTRTVTAGTVTLTGRAGARKVKFYGRVGKKKLTPGTYTVVITAKAGGITSVAHSLKFTIAKPPRPKHAKGKH
jgi:hypothetical protein